MWLSAADQARSPAPTHARSRGRFTHVTAWNHDVKPAASDYFPALVDWSSLAAVLHGTRPEA